MNTIELTCPHCVATCEVPAPEPGCVLPVYECHGCGITFAWSRPMTSTLMGGIQIENADAHASATKEPIA